MSDIRDKAERNARHCVYSNAALAFAILDLADAVREAGKAVATELHDTNKEIGYLAVAVQGLD